MSKRAVAVLFLGLGALIHPITDIVTALLAHEHPFDRSS
jgi:hypothetical protein